MISINRDNFKEEVLEAKHPVLVDLWAPWCGPCKMLSPIVEQISEETSQIKVVKINVDEAPELAQQYQVSSIPTLLVFRNGEEVNRSVGFTTKENILNLFEV